MSRQVVPEANPPELSLGPAEEPPAEGAKQWGVKEKPPPVRCLIAMNKDLQNAYRDEVLEDFQLRVGRQVRPRFRLFEFIRKLISCLLYTSPSPRDRQKSRMPSSA